MSEKAFDFADEGNALKAGTPITIRDGEDKIMCRGFYQSTQMDSDGCLAIVYTNLDNVIKYSFTPSSIIKIGLD